MNKVSCEIIRDMLPLYNDKLCSEDCKRMLEDHLLECNNCKVELEKLQDEIYISEEYIVEDKKT